MEATCVRIRAILSLPHSRDLTLSFLRFHRACLNRLIIVDGIHFTRGALLHDGLQRNAWNNERLVENEERRAEKTPLGNAGLMKLVLTKIALDANAANLGMRLLRNEASSFSSFVTKLKGVDIL